MAKQHYFPHTREPENISIMHILQMIDYSKRPATFFELDLEKVEELQQRSNLKISYDKDTSELSAYDSFTAKILFTEGFTLITWPYAVKERLLSRSGAPLMECEREKLKHVKGILYEEKDDGLIISKNEWTTWFFQEHYSFVDFEWKLICITPRKRAFLKNFNNWNSKNSLKLADNYVHIK